MKYPSYLNLSEAEWNKRVKKAWDLLNPCQVCPRECRVNRQEERPKKLGFCQVGSKARVYLAHPHHGEERCLVGSGGSGTIFFSSCNLACVYCQNYEISQMRLGKGVSEEELARMMIDLQNLGCHNINFVSPTIWVPQILKSLPIAIKMGLKLPLVYNTGGYDSVETLKLLDGIIDIYMPDMKYGDSKIAKKYSLVDNYWEVNKKAIVEMHRQTGDLIINEKLKISRACFLASSKIKNKKHPDFKEIEDPRLKRRDKLKTEKWRDSETFGIARRGLLVRHLVLPNNLAGTKRVMEFLAKEISKDIYVNIMNQYYPCHKAYLHPAINRRLAPQEYQRAVEMAKKVSLWRFDKEWAVVK